MTPERIDEFWGRVEDLPDAGIKAELLGLVREAVAAERERCRRDVDALFDGLSAALRLRLAAVFRARKES